MPPRPVDGVDTPLGPFVEPGSQLPRRPRVVDVEGGGGSCRGNPAMPAERQYRRLDQASGKPEPDIAIVRGAETGENVRRVFDAAKAW